MTTRADRPQRRQLSLLLALLGHEGRPVPMRELITNVYDYMDKLADSGGELTTSIRKLFERDKQALAQIGFHIQVENDEYCLPVQGLALRELTLNRNQVAALTLAVEHAQEAESKTLLRGALQKVQAASGYAIDNKLQAARSDSQSNQMFQDISAAITAEHRLEFEYRTGRSGALGLRAVSPWQIIVFQQSSYLYGYDHDRGDHRVYKFSRIQPQTLRTRIQERYRARSQDFSINEIFVAANKRHNAVLALSDHLLPVFSRHISTTHIPADFVSADIIRAEQREFGQVAVVTYDSNFTFAREITGFGPHAKVLYPPELRAEIRTVLEAGKHAGRSNA